MVKEKTIDSSVQFREEWNMRRVLSFIATIVLIVGLIPAFSNNVYAASSIAINKTNFPDTTFRAFVSDTYDKNSDGVLSSTELSVAYMDVSALGITDLSGIEFFTSLQGLDCSQNAISSLDLSENTILWYLFCYDNSLTDLDFSNNTKLERLVCTSNQLRSLNVSKNVLLTDLVCTDNKLTSLNVSKNVQLQKLLCEKNSLTSLNVSKNTALTDLICNDNLLASLDVSQNTALIYLHCYNNELDSLNVTKNSELYELGCANNQLKSLDVSKNTKLESFSCSQNQLTNLNVTKNKNLKTLYCDYNLLKTLDVSNNQKLECLHCEYNSISKLNLENNTNLQNLECRSNALTTLDVSNNRMLVELSCGDNNLTSLDVTNNGELLVLACSQNALTKLDLKKNLELIWLYCADNKLTDIDISKNEKLEVLYCQENSLAGLDISENLHLIEAYSGVMADEGLYYYQDSSDTFILCFDSECPVYTEIISKPAITKQPTNQVIAVGSKAKFSVKATGATKYQWYYRTSSDESWKAVSSLSGKTATYTLTAAERHNGYQYRCKVTNPLGFVYSSVRTLTVATEKPSVATQPKNQTVKVGDLATFTVKASGEGLTYQWYYRTSTESSWKAVSAASGKTASYSLSAAERHDGYQYRCKITNPVGSTYSASRTLTVVTEKPAIATQPKNLTVAAGKKATFTVVASGKGLSYQWYYRTSSDAPWTAVSAASGKTASYSLTAQTRHNGYQYRCKVTNLMGSVYTKTRTLTVN